VTFVNFYIAFVILTSVYRLWVSTRIPGVKKLPGQVRAAFTFWALFLAYALVVTASVVEFFTIRRCIISPLPTMIGLGIYLLGIIGREWPIRELGRFWSHHVEIRPDHELILTGPYRYLRHPNYACLLCEVLGFPLVSNSFFAFILSAVVYIPLVLNRIRHEEEALIEKFGERYREYRRCVPALFPIPGRTAKAMQASSTSPVKPEQAEASIHPSPTTEEAP